MKKGKRKEEGLKRKEKKLPGKPGPQPNSFSLSPFTFDEMVDIALTTKPKRAETREKSQNNSQEDKEDE